MLARRTQKLKVGSAAHAAKLFKRAGERFLELVELLFAVATHLESGRAETVVSNEVAPHRLGPP